MAFRILLALITASLVQLPMSAVATGRHRLISELELAASACLQAGRAGGLAYVWERRLGRMSEA